MFNLFGYPNVMTVRQVIWDGTADYLIIGGGGGAGGRHAGGGGAGGYKTSWAGSGSELSGGTPGTLEAALILSKNTAYSITVGRGGSYGPDGYRGVSTVSKGNGSSISGADITTVSVDGGGYGAGGNDEVSTNVLAQGGSSGGASQGQAATTHTLTDQGHGGGASGSSGAPYTGGGGGGAGGVGQTGYNAGSGTIVGGLPRTSSITGASVDRAGGGGGGQYQSGGTWSGLGGGGGAGNGTFASGNGTFAGDALAHTGSGAGGGGGDFSAGGNGASGTVILRLPKEANYSASQLASDVSSATNCTASYLNTQVYTDDVNFDDVILLMDGTSINEDLSPQNQTITEQNTSTALSSETDPFGNTQNVLDFSRTDATGSGLKITDSPMGLGNNPFTVEMFIKLDVTGITQTILSDRDSTNTTIASFRVNASNTLQFFKDNSGGGSFTGSTTMTTGTWYHVALTYDGSTVRMFLDGALEGSSNQTLTFNSSRSPRLGYDPQFPETTYQFDGRMAQVRITKGVARYTSAFTAPTSALPNGKTSTGGDHVITFTIADASGGNISSGSGTSATNRGSSDGTITWTPFTPPPPFTHIGTMYERTTTATFTQTFTPPTGAQAGDLLVLSCFQDRAGGNVTTGPSGWSTAGNLTAHPGMGQYYQIYNGTDTSWTVTWEHDKPTMGTVVAFRPNASISTVSTEQFQSTAGQNSTEVETISSVATTNAPGGRIYFYSSSGIENGSSLHNVSTVFNPSTDWTTVSGQGAVTNDGPNYAYRLAAEGDAFESTTASGTCSDRFAQAFFIINTS